MSERLSELLRQRALLQEHLAWLNREITAATARQPPPVVGIPPAAPPPAPAHAAVAPPIPATVVVPANIASVDPTVTLPGGHPVTPGPGADAILDQYRVPARSLHEDVRRGCLIYFVAALVLLGAGVVLLYFAISTR